MTYREALDAGYRKADWTLTKYVSKKVDIYEQPTHEAKGRRKGQLYVLLPNTDHDFYGRYSNYGIRQYLTK